MFGSLISGAIGGLGGLFGGSSEDPAIAQQRRAEKMFGKVNDDAFGLNSGQWQGGLDAARGQTSQYGNTMMDTLSGLATGEGPSLAQAQAQEMSQRSMAQQQALAAGGGANAALAATNAANNMANEQGSLAARSGQLRMQEQLGALQGMQSGISSMGQLENERLRQQLQAAGMEQQGGISREQLRAQQQAALFGKQGSQPSDADRMTGAISGVAGLIGGMF